MTPNSLCDSLIVYGTYAPGGANHHIFADLAGKWRKGKIISEMLDPPDGLGPDEGEPHEAWLITFDNFDDNVDMFTPAWDVEKRKRYDHWLKLDAAMGNEWARYEDQWWPEGAQTADSDPGMLVVNIYVPLANFSHLLDQYDEPPPGGEDDVFLLWNQVKRGEKRYEESHFLGLVKDARLPQIPELFGDLPNSEGFVSKLRAFFQDHLLSNDSVLMVEDEEYNIYVTPLERNAAPPEKLVELAQAHVATMVELLRGAGKEDSASALNQLEFRFEDPPDERNEVCLSADAVEVVANLMITLNTVKDNWMECLHEACYGIACSYELADWLVSDWYDTDVDLEPGYQLWKAGGRITIDENTCYVHHDLDDE